MDIGENYKLESDNLNITIYKRVKKAKGDGYSWYAFAYYYRLREALKAIIELEIKETHLKDVKAILAKQDELYQLISNLPLSDEPLALK